MGSLQASLRYFVLFQMLSSLLISKVIGDNNFIDCSISCTLSSSYPVKQSNQAAFVILPAVFTMTFQYQVSSSPSSSVLANIFDIYSYPLAKSILSLSMEAGSNQMHINYNNTNVMAYGPGVTYSSSQFTTFTLSISPRLVTLSNGVYSLSNNLAGVVLGSNCAIYISTNSLSSTSVNAGGTVKNIQFTGPPPTGMPVKAPTNAPAVSVSGPTSGPTFGPQPLTCCASTNYASSWQSCANSADTTLGTVTTCNNCIAYQCIDWTAGSAANQQREAAFLQRTGQNVYFGVGSYGNIQSRGGLCYRITVSSVAKDLLVQVVNQGADVPDGNFDLMVADGGFGLYDSCSPDGSTVPMYNAPATVWGELLGGVQNHTQCNNLPVYPICGTTPADNLQDLCHWSFNAGLRIEAVQTNPVITKMCQVACPSELYLATGVRRSDEVNTGYTCKTLEATGGFLTRMMDCAKPTYGWGGNIKGTTYAGMSIVVPCRRDGYTRVNAMYVHPTAYPSSKGTRSPTVAPNSGSVNPTVEPTTKPTTTPTAAPSLVPTNGPTSLTAVPSTTASPTYPSTAIPSATPTNQPSTVVPSFAPSSTPTYPTTSNPSTNPTAAPSAGPTVFVTQSPSFSQTTSPSTNPTQNPSASPTSFQTLSPSKAPTTCPSIAPTGIPTTSPTANPSISVVPSMRPSGSPSLSPVGVPTFGPSNTPTSRPTPLFTAVPTGPPATFTKAPAYSESPSALSTNTPSVSGTRQPIYSPSLKPSNEPSVRPSLNPTTFAPSVTAVPSNEPSVRPSRTPTITKTANPSNEPTLRPTRNPTSSPTVKPSAEPSSSNPTELPSIFPSAVPTPTYEPTNEPTPEPTPVPCICRYKMGCSSDSDCCSGLICVKDKTYSSCQESPLYNNYTNTKCFRSDSQYGCVNSTQCCNPQATCDAFVCKIFCSTSPTRAPTSYKPSKKPSRFPTQVPTIRPTRVPSFLPTVYPTFVPTEEPTSYPTVFPTAESTDLPTGEPTYKQTRTPSAESTLKPTAEPTFTRKPTVRSTLKPVRTPTQTPSAEPSFEPSFESTETPSSSKPSIRPSYAKTLNPSVKPSTYQPTKSTTRPTTSKPSKYSSITPTEEPTFVPTIESSAIPSARPSIQESSLVRFHSLIVLGNISSEVETLSTSSRAAVAVAFDEVLKLAIGSTFYLEDWTYDNNNNNNNGNQGNQDNRLLASSKVISIVSYLYTSISLSSFPAFVSTPQALFDVLRHNLSAALKNGQLQTVLRKDSSKLSAKTTIYATTANATAVNFEVQCPPSNRPTRAPVRTSATTEQIGVTMLSLIVAAGALGIALIGFAGWRIRSYWQSRRKRRLETELYIMNQKNISDSKDATYDLQIMFDENNINSNALVVQSNDDQKEVVQDLTISEAKKSSKERKEKKEKKERNEVSNETSLVVVESPTDENKDRERKKKRRSPRK